MGVDGDWQWQASEGGGTNGTNGVNGTKGASKVEKGVKRQRKSVMPFLA